MHWKGKLMGVRSGFLAVLISLGSLTADAYAATTVSDETIDAIVQKIDAGRYPEALAAAKAAMASYKPQPAGKITDKAFVRLLDCCAAASLGQKDYKNAQLAGARAFNSAFKGRSITMNLAVAETQLKISAVHAANIMRDFCDEHPEDVEAFALFGAALDRASQNRTSTKAIDPLIERYNVLLPKIEAGKPGYRRWGAKWVTDWIYDGLSGSRKNALSRVTEQRKALAQAQATAKQRQKELRQADWDNGQRRAGERRSLDNENRRVTEAEAAVKRAEDNLAESERAVPSADWSDALVLTQPDAALVAK